MTKKFKVKIIKKDNKPVGVLAASVNGRDVVLALHNTDERMTWYDAVKLGIPSIAEWSAIYENKEAVNKALVEAGGEPLQDGWYWSSTEFSSNDSWKLGMLYGYNDYNGKNLSYYVRPVLAL